MMAILLCNRLTKLKCETLTAEKLQEAIAKIETLEIQGGSIGLQDNDKSKRCS